MLIGVSGACNAAAGGFAGAVDPDHLTQIMSGGSRTAGLPVACADAFATRACFARWADFGQARNPEAPRPCAP
jgi:hypothetical protein